MQMYISYYGEGWFLNVNDVSESLRIGLPDWVKGRR